MTISTQNVSGLAEFSRRTDIEESPAWEFQNGNASQKPMPGLQHSRLQGRLAGRINLHCQGFEALPELRCTVRGRSLVPDLVILPDTDIPVDESGRVSAKGIEFVPPWVVEILSPEQSSIQVTRKILFLLRCGTQLGWLIDPGEQVVLVFQPDGLPEEFVGETNLPMLAGVDLTLTAAEMFGWLKGEKR
ncbi:hypothetical protein AY599_17015 [Leptolyngbya valderiana BDU 20041]|uniref:Uma2 family endonuclease n=1 Tax=Baaleninema simplex TaxID=2862350 RepID=UPI000348595C|nr:Uma2 family endonuclease [Baaleninema simplex]MDC0833144.1 Uma2 family endonuclease [Geitlerinema sp. CS-897]OAB57568.1 hypothetical protein AY599_17015 [Leptolyngbya valderiana BDU 20041]PPT07225.1 hypothetical protein CKA32_006142 [Geitlerinema sp. FC II]